MRYRDVRSALAASVGIYAVAAAGPALAQTRTFDIPAQAAATGIPEFARQADIQILVSESATLGRTTRPVRGRMPVERALRRLIEGTGLRIASGDGRTFTLSVESRGPGEIPAGGAAADSGSAEQEIIVTGTNIRGVAPRSSPVSIYTREQIEQTGASSTDQFMRTIPQNLANVDGANSLGISGNADVSNNQTRGAAINLRGIGPGATLTLLNGRRLAPAGRNGNNVDISLIPLSAIERVEVLPDGASAIYGADAVAGVVNFVLRDDLRGGETRLRYGTTTQGGGRELLATQSLGTTWSSGSILGVYEYLDQNAIRIGQRDFLNRRPNVGPETTIGLPMERHSAMVVARQELTPQLEVSGDLIFSRREGSISQESSTLGIATSTIDNRFWNANLGVAYDISADWQVRFNAAYGSLDGTNVSAAGTRSTLDTRTHGLDVIADGPVFSVPGGLVRTSLGGSWRRERLSNTFIGAGDNLGRTVTSAFAELFLPLIGEGSAYAFFERLELSGAVRYDRYSDFGSSVNGRIGALWSPARGLSFRSTFATSFRAPSLGEVYPLGETPLTFRLPNPAGGTIPSVIRLGTNPDLGPETSNSWNLGVDYAPAYLDGLNIRLTYFSIDYRNRISTPPISSINTVLFEQSISQPFLTFAPSLAEVERLYALPAFTNTLNIPAASIAVIFDNRSRNIARSLTEGIDFDISYTRQLGPVSLALSLAGQYLLTNDVQGGRGAASLSRLDVLYFPPDLRLRANATLSTRTLSGSLSVNHVDSYANTLITPNQVVESWTTLDLALRYRVPQERGKLGGLGLGLTVVNLLDTDPPAVVLPGNAGFGYDPANATYRGRSFAVTLEKRW